MQQTSGSGSPTGSPIHARGAGVTFRDRGRSIGRGHIARVGSGAVHGSCHGGASSRGRSGRVGRGGARNCCT